VLNLLTLHLELGPHPMRKILLVFIALSGGVISHAQTSNGGAPHFKDVTRRAGLSVPHISGGDRMSIIDSVNGGVGFIDCDNDGKIDIITVNGSSVARYNAGADSMITLYHQEEGFKFKDITREAGLTRKGWGMGVAVADFDNDGWQDIYVTGFGGSVLYRNKGNCTFEDITAKAGVDAGGFATGATWGDYDGDGLVDLFVPRYVHVDVHQPGLDETRCTFMGAQVFCGPFGFGGESDLLFHNKGDGTFEEVSKKAGVSDEKHYFGMQGIWTDYDNDGWPDLYVTNDRGPNYLYRNKHDGTFEDVSEVSGTAVSGDGREQGSMGVDAADFAHEGRFDLLVTNFTQEPDTLYRNRGTQGFDDISATSGIAEITLPYVGWGTGFVDFMNTGWDDIFVANGHIYPQMEQRRTGVSYRQQVLLFHNNHDRTFRDITGAAGLDKLPLHSRRGVAFGDVDNDGKVDVLILNVGEAPTLLLNCSEGTNYAALLKLVGTKSNKAAIGARVTVTAGSLTQLKEVRGGGSFLSQNDLRLHFGLGGTRMMNAIEIQWPSGVKQTLHDLPAGFIYTIAEGTGVQSKQNFAGSSCNTAP
jgi:enediyne biosynthesis protein E4